MTNPPKPPFDIERRATCTTFACQSGSLPFPFRVTPSAIEFIGLRGWVAFPCFLCHIGRFISVSSPILPHSVPLRPTLGRISVSFRIFSVSPFGLFPSYKRVKKRFTFVRLAYVSSHWQKRFVSLSHTFRLSVRSTEHFRVSRINTIPFRFILYSQLDHLYSQLRLISP